MLKLILTTESVYLQPTGLDLLFTGRGLLRLPRDRILQAFVHSREFAISASPHLALPGWSMRGLRIGRFGYGEAAQLWSIREASHVLALYLRGEPLHRVVLQTPNPGRVAHDVNQWLAHPA